MAKPTSVKLGAAELEDALKYLLAVGESDFFPAPFELSALDHSWDKVRPVLESVELLSYRPRRAVTMIGPKSHFTIRPIQLLDPVDAVLYTALAFRLAAAIQRKRDQYQAGIVYSYHFDASRSGQPRVLQSDWDGYRDAVREKAGRAGAVATADIADFFPRLYLHRLENALSHLGGDEPASRALMRLVEEWAHGTSQGIPVGLRASNVLAEALLIEVDEYLLSLEIDFVRYLDDFTIFGKADTDCQAALFELGARLLHSQSLSLNSDKTRIFTSRGFIDWRLEPHSKEQEVRDQIIDSVFDGDIYKDIEYAELDDETRQAVDEVDARQWLETALAGEIVDLKTVKFVLNFLSALRRPDLVGPVIENLDRLLPASEALGRFFSVLDEIDSEDRAKVGGQLLAYINNAAFVPDFQAMWLLEPFTRSPAWNQLSSIRQVARNHRDPMVRRQAFLAIGQSRDRGAILDARLAFEAAGEWEARAILYACRSLPRDERDKFYSDAGPGGDWTIQNVLLRAVIEYAKSIG